MAGKIEQEFAKKVTTLPDGRQLIYYNFTSEARQTVTVTRPQRESEA
jgi:hypothetical protein